MQQHRSPFHRLAAVAAVVVATAPAGLVYAAAPLAYSSRKLLVSDAVAALHSTEDALRAVHTSRSRKEASELDRAAGDLEKEADAPSGGGVVIESDYSDRADKLGALEARLERLEQRYEAKMASASASRKERLEAVRVGIEEAEERLQKLQKADAAERIEIDSTIVPYPGAVEQFGGEDAASNLTSSSVKETDAMIDSIEGAQAMEGKRAVNRALTHLRGAAITAYDGIAHGHLKNVDEYAKEHHWRAEHEVHHLAEEEADVERWAFPVHAQSEAANIAPAPASLAPAPATALSVEAPAGLA